MTVVRRLRRTAGGWDGLLGLGLAVVLIAMAVFGPFVAPHDPNAIDRLRVIGAPNLEFPFGSDSLGRDVLSRVLYALRVSLAVAVASVLISLSVGVPLGLVAG